MGGGFHLPASASDFGAYNRMQRLKAPLGAGNQFASLFAPGLSFWKYRSSEPSGLYLNGIQLLTANRFKVFATWNPSMSYSVMDQKACAGGRVALSKWMAYLLVPSSGLPVWSPRFSG